MNSIRKRILVLGLILMLVSLCMVLTACMEDDPDADARTEVHLMDGENIFGYVYTYEGRSFAFETPPGYGKEFLGWYTEEEGGVAVTDAKGKGLEPWKKTSSREALYAHWETKNFTIRFEYCGATSRKDTTEMSVAYGATIPTSQRMPVPLKSNYSFDGWYTAETGGIQITDENGVVLSSVSVYTKTDYPIKDGETILYARWSDQKVTYEFETEGAPLNPVRFAVGSTIDANTLPVPSLIKDNYCFVGWCFDPTHLSQMTYPYVVPCVPGDESIILYPKYIEATQDVLQFDSIAESADTEYEVSYFGDDERIVIPDSYYGKKVTGLKRIESSTLKEIVLPQTVNFISEGAFENCTALEKVNIPGSIQTLPERLFAGCAGLRTFRIPAGIVKIGKSVFEGCTGMTEITIAKSLREIGDAAFRNMPSMQNFRVEAETNWCFTEDGVLYCKMGNSLFYLVSYPSGRTEESYRIKEGTVSICNYAFGNARLSSIEIDGNIDTIGSGAFENCKNLSKVVLTGTDTQIYIGEYAFASCSNLRAIQISRLKFVPVVDKTTFDGVSDNFSVYVASNMIRKYQLTAGWRAVSDRIRSVGMIYGDFAVEQVDGGYKIVQYFGAAKELRIPEILNARKIVEIADTAFAFSGVEKVVISANVTKIGAQAFYNCHSLTEMIMEGSVPPSLGTEAFAGAHADFNIYIKGSVSAWEAYKMAEGWKTYADQNRLWSYNGSR